MSRIIKDGPQLTGAQALDTILAKLNDEIENPRPCTDESWRGGEIVAYKTMREYVGIIRAEKFDEPPTDNPWETLGKSKSYAL